MKLDQVVYVISKFRCIKILIDSCTTKKGKERICLYNNDGN